MAKDELKKNCPRCPNIANGEVSASKHLKNGAAGLSNCQNDTKLGSTDGTLDKLWWGFSPGDGKELEEFEPPAGLSSKQDCEALLDHVVQLSARYREAAKQQASGRDAQIEFVKEQKATAEYRGMLITKPLLEYALKTAYPFVEKQKSKAKKPSAAVPQSTQTAAPSQQPTTAPQNLTASAGAPNVNGPGPTSLQPSQTSAITIASTPGSNLSNAQPQSTAQSLSVTSNPSSQLMQSSNATTSTASASVPIAPQQQQVTTAASRAIVAIGAQRPPNAIQQAGNQQLQVLTNHFRINLAQGNHMLYVYQLTNLTGHNPPLGRSKKMALIKRFGNLSPLLSNASTFVVNGEGTVISWQPLAPGFTPGQNIDAQSVPDYDRAQPNAASRHVNMDLRYERVINLRDLFSYALGTNQNYAADVAEQALNILVGRAVEESNSGAWQIGDNHFFLPGTSTKLGWGLDAVRGYSSHVKSREGGVFLNVNTALSAFYRPRTTVNDITREINNKLPNPQYPMSFLNNSRAIDHMIGVRVRIMYNRDKPGETSRKDTEEGRLKTITGFSRIPAFRQMFTDSNGNSTSVWQHFLHSYPTQAQQLINTGKLSPKGNQLCINTGDTTAGRECWILAELLEVADKQIYRKTLDLLGDKMTADMITLACRRPHLNQADIETSGLRTLGLARGQPPPARLGNAGLSVVPNMLSVPIRQIIQPVVRYGGRTNVEMNSGKWSTRGMKFLTSSNRIAGKVALFCRPRLDYEIYQAAYVEGFRLAWPRNLENGSAPPMRTENFVPLQNMDLTILSQTLGVNGIGLLVLCLQAKNAAVRSDYSKFRIVADQMLGRPSLVICEDRMLGSVGNFTRGEQQLRAGQLLPYFANNMAKVNTRFGNQNHTVHDAFSSLCTNGECDTLVLGADLIHPKGNSSDVTPTIASVVGSVDEHFAKFLGSSRRMPPPISQHGREYIDTPAMINMVTERINAWRNANKGRLPARILYYRDGTGDSQYRLIHGEVAAIKTAYEKLTDDPEIAKTLQVTAVVAVKRHTTRFYPPANARDRSSTFRPAERTKTGNCVPGTVVDRVITSPYYFDFFLQSHDVEQGSAKPTHYFVLENGMNFSEIDLQNLTNAFCYNFSHSTSAISYASPAYYADRLCERSMLYLDSHYSNRSDVQNMQSFNARQQDIDICWGRGQQGKDGNPWNKAFNDVMFWM